MIMNMRSMVCAGVILCAFVGAWLGDRSLAVNLQESGVAVLGYSCFDVEGASHTELRGINNYGQIVGYYIDKKTGEQHGFLLANGAFTQIDSPVGINTGALGINDYGQIVGGSITIIDGKPEQHGFLRDNDGTFTPIDLPGGNTSPIDINDFGQIVGHVGLLPNDTLRGFLYAHGAFTPIDYPNALDTDAIGINNRGQVTGYFIEADEAGNRRIHGFLLNRINGVPIPIDYPKAPNTQAYGINNVGEIVGVFGADFDTAHGFLLSNHVYTPIDFPEAAATLPYGINDSGQIVGEFTDNVGVTHGFLATRTASYAQAPSCSVLSRNP